jgi:hypothetical protein
MTTTEYMSSILKATLFKLDVTATGINQTQYVIGEEYDVYPYDPTVIANALNDPLVFVKNLTIQGCEIIRDETGRRLSSDHPAHLQLEFNIEANNIIAARLLGIDLDWDQLSEDDQFLKYAETGLESLMRTYRIPYRPPVPFYQHRVVTPMDDPTLRTAELRLDLPYYGDIAKAVMEARSGHSS